MYKGNKMKAEPGSPEHYLELADNQFIHTLKILENHFSEVGLTSDFYLSVKVARNSTEISVKIATIGSKILDDEPSFEKIKETSNKIKKRIKYVEDFLTDEELDISVVKITQVGDSISVKTVRKIENWTQFNQVIKKIGGKYVGFDDEDPENTGLWRIPIE